MELVQLFLPLNDNDGRPQPRRTHRQTRNELMDRFGGLTVYSRAPAKGVWEDDPGHAMVDEMLVYEVMVEELDHDWWVSYRRCLEARFRQESVLIRALRARTF